MGEVVTSVQHVLASMTFQSSYQKTPSGHMTRDALTWVLEGIALEVWLSQGNLLSLGISQNDLM